MTEVRVLLDQIEAETLVLPEFQRGFVWTREQICSLMASLYQRYPIGSTLVWETATDSVAVRGTTGGGVRLLLLDGQQRLTTLFAIVRGRTPRFFDGDEEVFSSLYFNCETEQFTFFRKPPEDMDHWVNVTELFTHGSGSYMARMGSSSHPDLYLARLLRLHGILDRDVHQEKITAEGLQTVVDIFNQVNSGGTRLQRADMALARLCITGPRVRELVRSKLEAWALDGYRFRLDWTLRCTAATQFGRSGLDPLTDAASGVDEAAVETTLLHLDTVLRYLRETLGIDGDRGLPGTVGLIVLCRLLSLSGGAILDPTQRSMALYWYLVSAISGWYSGSSTERRLNADLQLLDHGGVTALLDKMNREFGRFEMSGSFFNVRRTNHAISALIYMMSKKMKAQDLNTGQRLSEVHTATKVGLRPIFPISALREHGYADRYINSIGNFAYSANGDAARAKPTSIRLTELAMAHPSRLESQWIPRESGILVVKRFMPFMEQRRELLASAASQFLKRLRGHSTAGEAPPGSERRLTGLDTRPSSR